MWFIALTNSQTDRQSILDDNFMKNGTTMQMKPLQQEKKENQSSFSKVMTKYHEI